jgi:hypothetical protein
MWLGDCSMWPLNAVYPHMSHPELQRQDALRSASSIHDGAITASLWPSSRRGRCMSMKWGIHREGLNRPTTKTGRGRVESGKPTTVCTTEQSRRGQGFILCMHNRSISPSLVYASRATSPRSDRTCVERVGIDRWTEFLFNDKLAAN